VTASVTVLRGGDLNEALTGPGLIPAGSNLASLAGDHHLAETQARVNPLTYAAFTQMPPFSGACPSTPLVSIPVLEPFSEEPNGKG